jgi:WD40 repeat protein/serine/threonine protein kinase/tetratricopeptide (TPR) repeat protein
MDAPNSSLTPSESEGLKLPDGNDQAMNEPETRVLAIFTEAMEIADAKARTAYLSEACGNDYLLRQEVEELLEAESRVGDFLPDQPYGSIPTQPHPGGTLRPPQGHTEYLGRRIDRYKLLQKIGEGGCGTVYMAEQERPVRRKVALKIIKLGMDTRSVVARFEAERQALALMDHPNIARVLDAGATASGRPYFVMELVRGDKITQYCDEQRFSTRQRLELFMQVCQAVQHAHQKGVIHRDLKPSNILVTERDDGLPVPKVIDFGIAKATGGVQLTDKTLFTAFEQFVGTPAYMSPEQARLGELDIDTRSDIYSLGVLLYELLTGQPPFEAAQLKRQAIDEALKTIRETDPPKPSTRLTTMTEERRATVARSRQVEPSTLTRMVRGDLDWIVMKCLEKDRTRRYETSNALALDIKRHLAKEPVTARPPSPIYRFQRAVQRHKAAVGAIAAVIGVLVLGVLFSSWTAMRAIRADAQLASLLNQVDMQRVEDFFNAGDSSKALSHLAYILRQDPSNSVAALRLYSALTLRGFALRLTPPLGHEGRVLFVHFSPDGKRIVSTSDDKTVRLWDSETGTPVIAPLRHDDKAWFADFSPDGNLLVTASNDKTARIWNAQTGLPWTGPFRHEHFLSCARFSSDGQRVITASDDQTARIWDVNTGQPIGKPLQHSNHVSCAVFSPDGLKAATASDDYTSRIWHGRTGVPLTGSLQHKGRVWYVQFSPDGQSLVTACDDGTARVWNSQTGQLLTELKHEGGVETARFSPDGQYVVTASQDRTARVWDAQTGQPVTRELRHAGRLWFACFSPDGQRIVTASDDGTARLWDARTGQELAEPLNHEGGVRFAEFSPDGNRVATASYDGTAQVWEARTGTLLAEPLRHKGQVSSACFSRSGQLIVTASGDKMARIWNAQTAQLTASPLQHKDVVNSAQFSPNERWVVTTSEDRTARVWDVQTGVPLPKPLKHDGNVYFAKFSPDGTRIVTASEDGKVRVWEALTGKLLIELLNTGWIFAPGFSPDGNRVLTAATDHSARIWDAQTGQPCGEPLEHGNKVASAEFSPDGKRVVTGSYDTTARVWDAHTGRPLSVPLKHLDRVVSVQFSPDGARVVTASSDRTARIWDAQTGRPLAKPLQHKDHVVSAQFSSDGKRVVTASDDGTARVWDTQSGQPLTEPLRHTKRVTFASFSSDGTRVVTASEDETARIWDVPAAASPVPPWAIDLTEVLANGRINDHRVQETVPYDRLPTLKKQALAETTDDIWTRWAKWFFADPLDRAVSPSSDETVSQYIQNRINENTLTSLQEAVGLSLTNGTALTRLARSLVAQGRDANSRSTREAEWYSARALEFAPYDGEAWTVRAQVLEQSGKLSQALGAIHRALELQPTNPDIWSIQAHLLQETNLVEEAYQSLTKAIEVAGLTAVTQTNSAARFYLERSRLLKSVNRVEQAQADLRTAMNIPRRDAGTSSRQADLTSYYNASLNRPWLPGDEKNDLSSLPVGLQTMAGVTFDVRGLIQVGAQSQIGEKYPSIVENIEIGDECTRLHFLHSAINCSSLAKGTPIGLYRIHYVDGTHSEIPIIVGRNVGSWWNPPKEQAGELTVAWEGANEASKKVAQAIRLYKTTWENPTPKIKVKTIDFLSNSEQAGPFLVAITAE